MYNTNWTVISINLHKPGNGFYVVGEIKTHAMPSQIVRRYTKKQTNTASTEYTY